MLPLSNVLAELRLGVVNKIRLSENEWLFEIGRVDRKTASPPSDDCCYLYSGLSDDP
jgi:hypothetical protein